MHCQVILNQGGKQFKQITARFPFVRAIRQDCFDFICGSIVEKAAHALHVRFHPQKVAAHIRMDDIFAKLVFTAGDKNFVAGEGIGTVHILDG
jgi:hypothetical protein